MSLCYVLFYFYTSNDISLSFRHCQVIMMALSLLMCFGFSSTLTITQCSIMTRFFANSFMNLDVVIFCESENTYFLLDLVPINLHGPHLMNFFCSSIFANLFVSLLRKKLKYPMQATFQSLIATQSYTMVYLLQLLISFLLQLNI